MDFWRDQNGTIAVNSSTMVLGFFAILEGSCLGGVDSICWRSEGLGAGGRAVEVAERSSASPTGTPEAVLEKRLAPPITERLSQLTDELRASGINVIYEYVRKDSYDCSLSHFLLLHGGAEPGHYFNVEAEFGDYRSQITMIDALVGTLVNPLRASR